MTELAKEIKAKELAEHLNKASTEKQEEEGGIVEYIFGGGIFNQLWGSAAGYIVDMTYDIATEMIEKHGPELVEKYAPQLIEKIVPELIDKLVPELIEKLVPQLIEKIVPNMTRSIAGDMLKDLDIPFRPR